MRSSGLDVGRKLALIRKRLPRGAARLPAPYPRCALVFAVSDGAERARMVTATGPSLESAWQRGLAALRQTMKENGLRGRWLRVDWVENARASTWGDLRAVLARTKRNYFRYGVALDTELQFIFPEQELNANAMLYGGNQIAHAVVNEKNFERRARARYGAPPLLDFADAGEVHLLTMGGIFCDDLGEVHLLDRAGRDGGRRRIDRLAADDVLTLIDNASDYLARQVNPDGTFIYGYHPCFDRRINAYNTLRHASTTYSMIEAWEVTKSEKLKAAIERSLDRLTGELIREVSLPDGSAAAFLVDTGNEIKLGGNAVAILALCKYSSVTGSDRHLPLARKLAEGIFFMQDPADGSFAHVLEFPGLAVKEKFRTIYYEGEAAFGLMRLYELTRDPRLLQSVERAFEHFIAMEHWKHNDHWLSYCVNELTRYRPDEKYFRFGIRNFANHLDFVIERITTFPTLLELMMAAQQMIERLATRPELRHLLEEVNLDKFDRALHARAHYLLNGHFWPELAMFYRNPDCIAGSFFIRHHAFRVRIDDVEHYLSGYIAYRRHLQSAPACALSA